MFVWKQAADEAEPQTGAKPAKGSKFGAKKTLPNGSAAAAGTPAGGSPADVGQDKPKSSRKPASAGPKKGANIELGPDGQLAKDGAGRKIYPEAEALVGRPAVPACQNQTLVARQSKRVLDLAAARILTVP